VAVERAEKAAGSRISFQCCSVFDAALTGDSTISSTTVDCSITYLLIAQDLQELIGRVLKPGGRTGLSASDRKAEVASPTNRSTKSAVFAVGLATPRTVCAHCGMRDRSRADTAPDDEDRERRPSLRRRFLVDAAGREIEPKNSSRISVKYP